MGLCNYPISVSFTEHILPTLFHRQGSQSVDQAGLELPK